MRLHAVFLLAVGCVCLHTGLNAEKDVSDDEKRFVVDGEEDMAAQIIDLKRLVHDLTERVNRLTSKPCGGSTYVRWGRTTCDGRNASQVYSGYMAGTYFYSSGDGDGANYLCLSNAPQWDFSTTSKDNIIDFTSVEYDFNPHKGSDIEQFVGKNVYGHQVPCAVCLLSSATSLMIPGRTECYPGWNKEYSGYIVTGYAGYSQGTEYVCLDRRPEIIVGSGNPEFKNVLYFVEANCQAGLECPPYENGRELACVVCSIASN